MRRVRAVILVVRRVWWSWGDRCVQTLKNQKCNWRFSDTRWLPVMEVKI